MDIPEKYPPRSDIILSQEGLTRYLVDELGMDPDIGFVVDPYYRIPVVASAFSEKSAGSRLNFFPTDERILKRYQQLAAAGALPAHLQNEGAFLRRHHELIGTGFESSSRNEIAAAVTRNHHNLPREAQQRIEKAVAHLFSVFFRATINRNPDWLDLAKLDTVVALERSDEGNFLKTVEGLRARLPRSHAGVIQCSPTLNDTLARCGETSQGAWQNVALLSNTFFNEELSRTIGQELFGLSQKRIFASSEGIAQGASDLIQQKNGGNKRIRAGFGALIMSGVHHLPMETIMATVHAAPELLALGGILVISELQQFPDSQDSVLDIIQEARTVFGKPETIRLMTTYAEEEGRQVTFMKRRRS